YLAFPEYATQIREVTSAVGFFSGLPPIQNALDGWKRIEDLGYRPRICSSPLNAHPDCEAEKRAWTSGLLGKQAAQDAYITRDKIGVHGLGSISVIPWIEGNKKASWQHVVFDMPYNSNSPIGWRLRGWDDRNLPDLLRAAQCRHRGQTIMWLMQNSPPRKR